MVISFLVGVVLAETALRGFRRLALRDELRNVAAQLQAFRDAKGDDVRQAALLQCGRTTLYLNLKLLGIILALAFIAVLAPWMLAWNESQQITYLVFSAFVATGWWVLDPCSATSSSHVHSRGYSLLERWLHWLALESSAVCRLSFDLERQFALPERTALNGSNNNPDPADGAVYICGLARSGTTMMLHILDEIDSFRSLTYRAVPFVLAPNLWKLLSQYVNRVAVPAERAHGDNVNVHFDSPEGFEEVFWRTFGMPTRDSRCFGCDEPSAEALAAFADYRALVANPRNEAIAENGKFRRYLSKNNNNLLRLRSLCADPTATVLLVYRNPVATARSLYLQHQRFCAAQTEDAFTRTYMGWFAHHEFGLDHLPFSFALSGMNASLVPDDLNYWLDYWNAVYRHILAQNDLRLYLVNHDVLCAEPVETLTAIFNVLGVQADAVSLAKRINAPSKEEVITDGFCPDLLRRAEATFRALLDSQKNITASDNIVKPK